MSNRLKNIGKKFVVWVMTLTMIISIMPTNLLVAFAAPDSTAPYLEGGSKAV